MTLKNYLLILYSLMSYFMPSFYSIHNYRTSFTVKLCPFLLFILSSISIQYIKSTYWCSLHKFHFTITLVIYCEFTLAIVPQSMVDNKNIFQINNKTLIYYQFWYVLYYEFITIHNSSYLFFKPLIIRPPCGYIINDPIEIYAYSWYTGTLTSVGFSFQHLLIFHYSRLTKRKPYYINVFSLFFYYANSY